METIEDGVLPPRLFSIGHEPSGANWINSYFNLRWIENIKPALEDEHIRRLDESQFGQLMKMGNHTFPVVFVHYLLSRQLLTDKKRELWWLFGGKPIRYGIEDFALVTGLNCSKIGRIEGQRQMIDKGKGKSKTSESLDKLWSQLFGDEGKPTTSWILDKLLRGKKYKDPLTRFRLALLFLVDGILCPTCKPKNITKDRVAMVEDIDSFLSYPWGRESFVMTVNSTKARSASQFSKKTVAIQGFSHAMALVTLSCCPEILSRPRFGEGMCVEDIVQSVTKMRLDINVDKARVLDKNGQVSVRSLLSGKTTRVGNDIAFSDDKDDPQVDHMEALIMEGHPFEHNSWEGGVKAADVAGVKKRKTLTNEEQSTADEGFENEEESADNPEVGNTSNADEHGEGGSNRVENQYALPRDIPSLTPPHSPLNGEGSSQSHGYIREMADAFEERSRKMFEEYTLSVKTHFDEYTLSLKTHFDIGLAKLRSEMINEIAKKTPNNVSEEDGCRTCGNSKGTCGDEIVSEKGGEVHKDNQFNSEGRTVNAANDVITPVLNVDIQSHHPQPIHEGSCASENITMENMEVEINGIAVENIPTGTKVAVPCECTSALTFSLGKNCPPGDRMVLRSRKYIPSKDTPSEDRARKPSTKRVGKAIQHDGPDPDPVVNRRKLSTTKDTPSEDGARKTSTKRVGKAIQHDDPDPHPVVNHRKLSTTKDTPSEDGARKPSTKRVGKAIHDPDPDYDPDSVVKRRKRSTTKDTESEDGAGKLATKRVGKAIQHHDSVVKSRKLIAPLVGDFNPFCEPNSDRTQVFLKLTEFRSSYDMGGVEIESKCFTQILESRSILDESAVDMLVRFIQHRRDKTEKSRFDFLPPSFEVELRKMYSKFLRESDQEKFCFSTLSSVPFTTRPRWFSEVDFIYLPVLIERDKWVGVIIKLRSWSLSVIDCNKTYLTDADLQIRLQHISTLIPLLICKHGLSDQGLRRVPFLITRVPLSFVNESSGLDAISILVLLEQHSIGNIDQCSNLNEDYLHNAAENYAIEAFATFFRGKEIPNLSCIVSQPSVKSIS